METKDEPKRFNVETPFGVRLAADYVAIQIAAGKSVDIKQMGNGWIAVDTFTCVYDHLFNDERDGKIFQHG